jgi:hypothetical protein
MMKRLFIYLAVMVLAAGPALAQGEDGSDSARVTALSRVTSIPLTLKTYRNWKISLPAEEFAPVGPAFRFAGSLGRDFTVKPEGTTLLVDCDGDGKVETRAEGKGTPCAS